MIRNDKVESRVSTVSLGGVIVCRVEGYEATRLVHLWLCTIEYLYNLLGHLFRLEERSTPQWYLPSLYSYACGIARHTERDTLVGYLREDIFPVLPLCLVLTPSMYLAIGKSRRDKGIIDVFTECYHSCCRIVDSNFFLSFSCTRGLSRVDWIYERAIIREVPYSRYSA